MRQAEDSSRTRWFFSLKCLLFHSLCPFISMFFLIKYFLLQMNGMIIKNTIVLKICALQDCENEMIVHDYQKRCGMM